MTAAEMSAEESQGVQRPALVDRPGRAPLRKPQSAASRTYVVQVVGGREEHVRRLIEAILPADAYEEVFSPRCMRRIRRQGEWRVEEQLLTPGYLYLVTSDPASVSRQLGEVPALTKLLTSADSFQPLADEETIWLEALTAPGERTIDVSRGIAEGDRVVVTEGPLVGQESLIARIDRHKRLAWLSIRILGRTKLVKVGLEVVRKSGQTSQDN